MINNVEKHSECLILMQLSIDRILSDQFAAWQNDATAQQGLGSSHQAFEKVSFLLKALESENISLHLWKY